jgi:REP element-mobilizing transposase RayT
MAHVANTGTDTFSRGQNHSGGVAVWHCDNPHFAHRKGSHDELEACLSVGAPRRRHRRRGGVRSLLPTLWTNSYLAATVGDATLEVVKRHVENQPNA